MALTTLADYKAFAGITSTDATRDAALTAILAGVEAAVKKLCRPYVFESTTLTWVLDAPWQSPWLSLPAWPVRSLTSVHYRADAKGDSSLFTSDYLLTQYTDYRLDDLDPVTGWSRSGRVRRLNRAAWGVQYTRPMDRLSAVPLAEPGSVKVVAAVGPTSVPEDVIQAVHLAAGLVYARRTGAPVTSESWNGYSASLAGPFTAAAAVHSPDVLALLSAYVTPLVVA